MKRYGIKAACWIAATLAFVYAGLAPAAADNGVVVYTAHTTAMTPIQLVGGTGTYSFVSDVCAEGSTSDVADVCSISSSGSYTSVVCGTMTMAGVLIINTPFGNVVVNYNVTMVAGIGVMIGTPLPIGVMVFLVPAPGTNGTTCTASAEFIGVIIR